MLRSYAIWDFRAGKLEQERKERQERAQGEVHEGPSRLPRAAWVNRQEGKHGRSALHMAALQGHVDILKLLVEAGGDLDIEDFNKVEYFTFPAVPRLLRRALCATLTVKKTLHPYLTLTRQVTPRAIISRPGPVHASDLIRAFPGMVQEKPRTIGRLAHPEAFNTSQGAPSPYTHTHTPAQTQRQTQTQTQRQEDQYRGWPHGDGGWRADRWSGADAEAASAFGLDASSQAAYCDVDELWAHETSPEVLFREYLAAGRPVLIRGLLHDWPAAQAYRAEALAERFGEVPVTVSSIPYAKKFKAEAEAVDMSLGDYIREVQTRRMEGGEHPWYVFKGNPIPQASERHDSMVQDNLTPLPPPPARSVWLGN